MAELEIQSVCLDKFLFSDYLFGGNPSFDCLFYNEMIVKREYQYVFII